MFNVACEFWVPMLCLFAAVHWPMSGHINKVIHVHFFSGMHSHRDFHNRRHVESQKGVCVTYVGCMRAMTAWFMTFSRFSLNPIAWTMAFSQWHVVLAWLFIWLSAISPSLPSQCAPHMCCIFVRAPVLQKFRFLWSCSLYSCIVHLVCIDIHSYGDDGSVS